MTDNEIIKALEVCSGDELGSCRKCPGKGSGCELEGYALALINRQKAEIKRLEAENEKKRLIAIKTDEAIREFAERLKKRMGYCDLPNGIVRSHIEHLVKEMIGAAK